MTICRNNDHDPYFTLGRLCGLAAKLPGCRPTRASEYRALADAWEQHREDHLKGLNCDQSDGNQAESCENCLREKTSCICLGEKA